MVEITLLSFLEFRLPYLIDSLRADEIKLLLTPSTNILILY